MAKNTWTYNSRGQVLTATRVDLATKGAVSRKTTYTYCEQANIAAGTCPLLGLLTSVDGARTDVGDVTTFTYYPTDDATCATAPTSCPHRRGDLWKVTNALGQVSEFLRYDGAGRALAVKDPNGVTTEYGYSPRGLLSQVAVRGIDDLGSSDDAVTTIVYEPTGTVSKVTQPDGDFLVYTYDAAHRLTDVADALGNTIHYTLDNAGNRTAEDTKDPAGGLKHTMSTVFDQLGRVQKLLNAASQATLVTYDVNDNVDLVSDPLNHTSNQDFDALNRQVQVVQDVGGLNVLTKFKYDANDNLTQVTDPKGLTTTYTYNALKDLMALASPDTGSTKYTYDSAGNRATRTDARNVVTTYSYDQLNRVKTITYPTTALKVTYVYDTANAVCQPGESYAKGHLTQFLDSTGNTQFCYDRFGNLTRKVQVNGSITQTTRFEYTMAGSLYRVTYPSGAQALYARNAMNQVTGVELTIGGVTSTLVSNVGYYPYGPISQIVFGNGRVQTRNYDLDYAIDSIADPGMGGLNLEATVNAIGNVSSMVSTLDGIATARNYTYDGLDRLKVATTPGAASLDENFTYDATGNRLSKKIGTAAAQTYVYPTTSHKLSSVAGVARTYDGAGNTLTASGSSGAQAFTYDDRGRMTQSKLAGAVYRNHTYNARGERISRIDPSNAANTTTFAYDEAGRLLGDYSSTGIAQHEYVWLDGVLVGVIAPSEGSASKFEYVETDQLGTPRTVVDPERDVAIWRWSATGSTFGDHAPEQDADGNGTSWAFGLRYPGQVADGGGMPNYNYFRDYEPATGRYLESDPIGLAGGISSYAYVRSAPLRFSDRWGLVDVNLLPTNYEGYSYAQNYNPAGICTVTGHGNPLNMVDAEGLALNANDIGNEIRAHCGEKRRVQLISCNTGLPGYNNSTPFAQQLADDLGAGYVVEAPNNFTWWVPEGPLVGGTVEHETWSTYAEGDAMTYDRSQPGQWIPFTPSSTTPDITP